MSRRALVNCERCSDPIRKDKMVKVIVHSTPYRAVHNAHYCNHCFKSGVKGVERYGPHP